MTIQELIENKATIIAQKKATIKHADACVYASLDSSNENITKDSTIDTTDIDKFTVKAAINTTGILDSHGDVHIKGLWNKSLKENKMIMHLQEHKMTFDAIISDGKDLKTSAKMMSFKDLGYNYDGDTQVLLFESTVKRSRNEEMFKRYAKGEVKNHSVGMQYVKLELAVNNEEYKAEKAIWDKYISQVANRDYAEEKGYFWAVLEAKVIEGSAVPLGSNSVTPTIEIQGAAKGTPEIIEPSNDTRKSLIINHLI